MAKKAVVHRKQRTREHVIADLSVHHVEGFVLQEGHTAQRVERDYGYDLVIANHDSHGYAEPGVIFVQLKAAEQLRTVGTARIYDIDIRDYNLWILESSPVILILYDASRNRAYWLAIRQYFHEDATRRPKRGAKTVRVRIPQAQRLDRGAIAQIRAIKNAWKPLTGGGAS